MKLQIIKQRITNFLQDEEGLTTVEYAIAGSLVGLAVVTAFTQLGEAVGFSIDTMTTVICGASGVTAC